MYMYSPTLLKETLTPLTIFQFMFVCLFVCLGGFDPLESFHSYRDVTVADEGLQMLTCARHSWPLSIAGS